MRLFRLKRRWFLLSLCVISVIVACQAAPERRTQQITQHNAIIFVADGLRPTSINPKDTPALNEIRERGVKFSNSHSLFPTFTTANASAIATGHYLGDTGDFSNTIKVNAPVKTAKNSLVPYLENNLVLREVNRQFGANYLNEESLLAIARKAGFSTAAVGKIGPVFIQDITQDKGEASIIFDDSTGTDKGIPLSQEVTELLSKNSLPKATPSRGDNGKAGDSKTPGTKVANVEQQQYFADATTKVILPLFQKRQKPFVLVYWSRDPDGTQHSHGDSLNQLVPGINGPTTLAARKNVDKNLAQIRTALSDLGLQETTNIFVVSDHGFSTISKESKTSYAATLSYPDVPKGFLPVGFVAIDIAQELQLPLFDPDNNNVLIDPTKGQSSRNNIIAKDPKNPDITVAGNGGSDLIYLRNAVNKKEIANRIVDLLLKQDYVSGIFVDESLGKIPGTLPIEAIALRGAARTPTPSIMVNFRSFDTGCGIPTACGVEISDTTLQQGQGMHGSFSRADTYNTMAAIGPDFKQDYEDLMPASNADVPRTIAKILNLKLSPRGKLVGRVLDEALKGGPDSFNHKSFTLKSPPADNGLTTVLKYQTVGKTRYFDTAGFPGRTLGLST
ncbi:alkaline phosphatase family protein [Iningainema tapete]|uniref:Alkaline phosphatase family protein n=1 Tax=Iningainema tapete BLCC-T55 TaxID=2748662 RepID=A0A8J6XDL7_9CYAN|nr:alkaline phosphatase family protein [Iningainema tapete]MBD2773394.1 alkaline phosphatase family protein [Iningainema tapete BLCC-T55]